MGGFQNFMRRLERKAETGANVQQELDRLRKIMKGKIIKEVPAELLPEKSQQGDPQKTK